jgi:hypothetical protein
LKVIFSYIIIADNDANKKEEYETLLICRCHFHCSLVSSCTQATLFWVGIMKQSISVVFLKKKGLLLGISGLWHSPFGSVSAPSTDSCWSSCYEPTCLLTLKWTLLKRFMLVTGNKAVDLLVRAVRQQMWCTPNIYMLKERRIMKHEQSGKCLLPIYYIKIHLNCLLLHRGSEFISFCYWYQEFLYYILLSIRK